MSFPLSTSHEIAWSIALEYAKGGYRRYIANRLAPAFDKAYACVHFGEVDG